GLHRRHCERPKGEKQSRAFRLWPWIASSAVPPRDDDGDKGFSGRSFPAWRGEKHRMTSGVGASRGEGAAPCLAGSGGLDWRTGVMGVRSGWWARCLLATLGADMRYISPRGQAPALAFDDVLL